MNRTCAILACGVVLAGCSSLSSPSLDLMTPEPAILTIDSRPRGAEANVSNSGTCYTPCTLSVPVAAEFTITYTLDGYVPQIVPVRPIPAARRALIDLTPPRFDPNPVIVELQPAAPPPEPPPVKKPQRSLPRPPAPAPPPYLGRGFDPQR
jgi:hypothetical protein